MDNKSTSNNTIKDIYPLSPMQEGMLFHYLLGGNDYFEQISYRLHGKLDIGLIERSFQALVDRYDIFRTIFLYEGYERPLQVVLKAREGFFTFNDIRREVQQHSRDIAVENCRFSEKENKFKLNEEVPMRFSIYRTGEEDYEFIWSFHHILMDGWCISIIVNEFNTLYQSYLKNIEVKLPAVKPYSNYISWLESQDKKINLEYWGNYLSGYESLASISGLVTTSAQEEFILSTEILVLDKHSSELLRQICRDNSITLNTLLQCAWGIVLSKYNSNKDVIFGSVVSGRPSDLEDIERMVGLFINTIPVRITYEEEETVFNLLKRVQEKAVESESHHYSPFSEIQLISNLGTALIDHIMVFENYPIAKMIEEETKEDSFTFTVTDFKVHEQTNYDLTLVVEPGEEIRVEFRYNSNIYESEQVKRLLGHYNAVVNVFKSGTDSLIKEIDIVTSPERHQLLYEFNDKLSGYPRDTTLVDLFEEQVERTPDSVAIVFEDKEWSYQQINSLSNQLARILIAKGCSSNAIVGLLTNRGPWTIIAMLAILKAGGCYMPIDIDYPAERIQFQLADSKTNFLITEKSQTGIIGQNDMTCIFIDEINIENEAVVNLNNQISPDNLCYIIYTSGTTGKPKGVMVEHKNVISLLFNEAFQFDFGTQDVWTMYHSQAFDFSVWEMYGSLLYGGKLIIVPKKAAQDLRQFLDILQKYNVTVLNQTPTAFYSLSNIALNILTVKLSLRYIIFGGEALNPSKIKDWKLLYPNVQLINMFGITETTVHVTYKEITTHEIDQNLFTIGKPIPTLSVYLLDKNKMLVPIGLPGELYVGGAGVARGYLNREQLTSERFIINPFYPQDRLYKSGDLGRWLPDGNIEYLGRLDDQVKIRGHRIELGEIESHLVTFPGVKEAVVQARELKGEKYLIGYYVSAEALSVPELIAHLSGSLPDYMLPAYYVHLDSIPLTSNGKTDRKRLPDPDLGSLGSYVSVANETEAKLLSIWSEVLELEQDVISADASFFRLGGHSLKAITLVNKISRELDVDVPLREVFSRPDIRSLGAYIRESSKSLYSGISMAGLKAHYALSSAQSRMYFLYEFDRSSLVYNMPYVVELEGSLDKSRVESTFRKLIDRHESLRTTFDQADGQIVQRVHQEVAFSVSYTDVGDSVLGTLISEFIRPFDLQTAPLLRVGLLRQSAFSHLLLVDMHHIITDGVSQGLLISDFMSLYNNEELGELRLQYKDYAEWQQGSDQQSRLSSQREFWQREFAEEVTVLELPSDHPRPVVKSYGGSNRTFTLSRGETDALKAIGSGEGATLFMTLLSVLNILLSKLSNQEDITIGTPVAGRGHADLEGIMGLFVNTLALRNYPSGDLSFKSFVSSVKDRSLSCFDNQDYPYEELINDLQLQRDTGRNPLFDVMFTFLHLEQKELIIPGLKLRSFDQTIIQISKFDLELTARESEEGLDLNFEYSTELFMGETIDRFIGYFLRIVSQAISDPEIRLSSIGILSPDERHQLLYEFNDTFSDYPRDKTIIDLFEEQVAKTPDNVAVKCGDDQITYRLLKEKSERIAGYLQQEYGIKEGDFVGLLLEREQELLPCIFGIMRSGAVYVPLSAQYPPARVSTIASDAGLKVIITRQQYMDLLSPDIESAVLNLDTGMERINAQPHPVLQGGACGNGLAYVIYTSGSTGKPKGVMIEHHSVVNRLLWMQQQYLLTEQDVLLQKTSLVFDVSVWELFWWSITGASVCLLPPGGERDPEMMISEIARNGVTTIHFVPPMLGTFLEIAEATDKSQLRSVRQVFASGEALSVDHVNKFGRTLHAFYGTRLINLYGPTEATVDVSYYECDFSGANEIIPIGKPIDNSRLYVVDNHFGLSPIGVVGELCIGGAGLARGYLNNAVLTDEKFISVKFDQQERLYRTGDLACWLPDGNIEFLGRLDDQVKIRGHRIELGEIESHLVTYDNVKQAFVTFFEKANDKKLVAFLVPETNSIINTREIKKFLRTKLPDYMIPTLIRKVDKIQLTNNGKINKKVMLEMINKSPVEKSDIVRPKTEIEIYVAKMWAELLTTSDVNVDANFFDVGGHSILLVRVNSMINKKYNIELPFSLYFNNTLEQICQEIESKLQDVREKQLNLEI